MKVLMVHNYYQQTGGEDKVVLREMELLNSRGIDVSLYSVHNNSIQSKTIMSKIKLAINTIWSYPQYRKIIKELSVIKPDIVHIHNFFPLISPSVYYACKKMNIPVIQTLHNFRLLCPAATLLRDSEICHKCINNSLLYSVKYGCYRGSKTQTVPVSMMLYLNRYLKTWDKKVDRYIALSEFVRNKFIESGISKNKIVVKPNFLDKEFASISNDPKENIILFVGRISVEKGLSQLLNAWGMLENKKDMRLVIVGDGPERQQLEGKHQNNDVIFLGSKSTSEVHKLMKKAKYVIVPSIGNETFGLVSIEAFAVGTPVLCSSIGALPEVVEDGITGFHFKHSNIQDMAQVINKAIDFKNYDQLRKNAFRIFVNKYSSDMNFNMLVNNYREVIEEKNNAKDHQV